ncbi:PaaI family thioesterase [Saliphagus sp. LR7]|uniref:PaaI family thioesterase n=1 Tax=Saliphagus sp. LR7 TaxID=2282654 RepID=UPI000DF7F7D3|nr:PaaI family thioesterase [Saliphagus sp. LR7]
MSTKADPTVEVKFDQEAYERLSTVTDTPADFLHEAAMDRVELAEAIAYTREEGFHGPKGFAKLADDTYPTWPLGSVLGIELESMGDGESRWRMEVGAEHANPMGTMHGGVLCDIGDAALSTAFMSTLEDSQMFTTVDLRVNFLRPVRTGRLVAIGRVIHRGHTIGMAESEVTNEDDELVAKLSGTCMTLGDG